MRGDEQVAERVRGVLSRGGPEGDEQSEWDRERSGWDDERRPSLLTRLRARVPVRVPVRLDPGHRAALAVGVAVLVAALVTGAWMLASRPRALPVSASAPPIPGASSPVGTSSPSVPAGSPAGSSPVSPSPSGVTAADLVVDVAGKVVRPGLYHLPPGARVADAVTAAGGVQRGVDLTTVNLAAKVSDGQQIVIGAAGAAGAASGGVPGAGGGAASGSAAGPGGVSPGGPVDLNTATLEQLETLPGIGPALGQRILDWRTAHGSFASVDQLNDVSGIGDVKFAALKPRVTT